MKKQIKIILNCLLIFLISLIASCDDKNKTLPINVIPLESAVGKYPILNLSDYSTEIKYIPLETNDSALIGTITQIIYENEKIFIKSISGDLVYHCYLFDNSGMFSRKIGQHGQGPDDYIALYGRGGGLFENFIYLMDAEQNKLLIYDTTGLLVNNVKLRINEIPEKNSEDYSIYHTFPLNEDTFVMNVVSFDRYSPKAVLLEKDQSYLKTIKEYTNYVQLDKQPGYTFAEVGVMYRFGDNVRTYKPLNDTIFTIDQNTDMKAAFIFELGKYGPTLSYIEGKEPDARDNYIVPFDIFESFNHLFINFRTGIYTQEPFEQINKFGWKSMNQHTYGVFDKFTGELTLMQQPIKGKLGFKNDVDNGPVIWPHYISSNNELVTYISAESFLEYYSKIENPTSQMTEIAKNVKPDDNEIVIIAKLKEKSHDFAD